MKKIIILFFVLFNLFFLIKNQIEIPDERINIESTEEENNININEDQKINVIQEIQTEQQNHQSEEIEDNKQVNENKVKRKNKKNSTPKIIEEKVVLKEENSSSFKEKIIYLFDLYFLNAMESVNKIENLLEKYILPLYLQLKSNKVLFSCVTFYLFFYLTIKFTNLFLALFKKVN